MIPIRIISLDLYSLLFGIALGVFITGVVILVTEYRRER